MNPDIVIEKPIPVLQKVDAQEERLKKLEAHTKIDGKKKKEKKWTIKVPGRIKAGAQRKGSFATLWLGANKGAEFKKVVFEKGLLYVGALSYAYDEGAIYRLKQGMKTLPLIVIYEDRLIPVGGTVEKYVSHVIHGKKDENAQKDLKKTIHNLGQMTIIRGIENAEIEKDGKKKKGGGIIIWIILGVAAIYLAAKALGFA